MGARPDKVGGLFEQPHRKNGGRGVPRYAVDDIVRSILKILKQAWFTLIISFGMLKSFQDEKDIVFNFSGFFFYFYKPWLLFQSSG
jgi:hypothetical protein